MTANRPPKTLRKQAVYPHPIERVWSALTDPDALAQWLMPNNFEPVAGRAFEFRVDPNFAYSGIVRCRVLEIDPPRRMLWSWETTTKKGNSLPPMHIEWTLAAEGPSQTRLTLFQTGLEHQPRIYNLMMAFGWGTMLKRWLPKVIDAFETSPTGGYRYRRLDKAPNRGQHTTKTLPPEFHR